MGQRADGKYGGPDGESYTKFGEKTSEHGHWEVGPQYAGTNTDGTKWHNTKMRWVEDNRKFEAPPAAPEEANPEPEPEAPVVLSDNAAKAKAYTQSYENILLPKQGDYTTRDDTTVIDDFNNDYSLNLRKEKQPKTPKEQEAQNFADIYKQEVASFMTS